MSKMQPLRSKVGRSRSDPHAAWHALQLTEIPVHVHASGARQLLTAHKPFFDMLLSPLLMHSIQRVIGVVAVLPI